jgi:hypothetical protein
MARRSIAQPDTRLQMQYIGAVSLLGRLAAQIPKGHELHFGITKAISDCNNFLLATESEIRFCPASGGGYAAFEVEQAKEMRAQRMALAKEKQ